MSTVETLVGRIGWHELVTPDVAKAKAFYTELLGWETETFQPSGMDYELITVGGQSHGGFLASDQVGGAPPHWVAYVLVESAEKTATAAQKTGGKVVHGPQEIPEVGTFVVVSDPQGAVIAAISGE